MGVMRKLCWPVVVLMVVSNLTYSIVVHGQNQMVPCYFIFGDSLVDNGNNNNLKTKAKANYMPYGIDFPDGTTGRFCNGRTTADVFGEMMGFEDFIKPFAIANGTEILNGVNYASSSCGILDETGRHMGHCFSFQKQIENHKITLSRIGDALGCKKKAQNYAKKCLYSVVIGSNDYINNYYIPQYYNTSNQYTPKEYAKALIKQYANHVETLYKFGARKIAMTATAPIGCTPNATALYPTNSTICVDNMNYASMLFNKQIQSLAKQLNDRYPDAKFVYLRTYSILQKILASPTGNAISLFTGCCPVDDNGFCVNSKPPCPNRKLSLFFDSFHPSELVNQAAATISFVDLMTIL